MMSLRKKAGFTLLETLVAVTIFTIAIGGPFFAASRALVSTTDARNRLTATYLAQEGIEYIQSMRNTTYLADYLAGTSDLSNVSFNANFKSGSLPSSITTCYGGGDGTTLCALDPTKPMGTTGAVCTSGSCALALCGVSGGGPCPTLNLSSGEYTLDAGTATSFVRTIQFYDIGYYVQVKVTVSWASHGQHSIVATDYLSPWQ